MAPMRKPETVPNPPNKSEHSRRRHVRDPLVRFVWFQILTADGALCKEGISYSVDLSLGGLGLVVSEAIAAGTLLFLEVLFEPPQQTLAAVGEIVHSQQLPQGYHRLGIKFIALSPDSRQFLAARQG